MRSSAALLFRGNRLSGGGVAIVGLLLLVSLTFCAAEGMARTAGLTAATGRLATAEAVVSGSAAAALLLRLSK